jgi:hypothetical protein
MKDEIVMSFAGVIDEAMSIVQAEEATTFLTTRRQNRHRRYVNRDCDGAHFRLRQNYYDDDYMYLCHTSSRGIVCE